MALTCKSRIPSIVITEIVTRFLNIFEDGEPVMQALTTVKGFENIEEIWLDNTRVDIIDPTRVWFVNGLTLVHFTDGKPVIVNVRDNR